MTKLKNTGQSETPGPHPGENPVTSEWLWAQTHVTLNVTLGSHTCKFIASDLY